MRALSAGEWLGGGLLIAAIAASSWTWYSLALRCGFPPGLAAVPAISLDLGGIAFGRNWIFGRTDQLRRWGRITTIAAVVVSVAGNSIEHAIAADLIELTPPIVLAVGAIPAAAVFAVAHQLGLAQAPVRTAPRPRKPTPAAPVVAPPEPLFPTATQMRTKRGAALDYARRHWPVTAAQIKRGLAPQMKISDTEAARVRDMVAAERAAS